MKNLEVSKFSEYKSLINNIEDKTLREIWKYKNHSSFIAIQFDLKTETHFIS